MSRKKLWAGATLVAALAIGSVTGVAHAQGARDGKERMGPGRGGPGGRGMSLLRELGLRQLDLSDAQQEQVRGILQSHEASFREIGDRQRAAHQNLYAAVSAASFDEAAIRARSAEVAAVQADAAVLRGKVRSEVWSILTNEQQQKAAELKTKVAERAEQRRQRMQQRQQQRQQRPGQA